MKRKIKFRGRQVDNGEWVHGTVEYHLVDGDLTKTKQSAFITYDSMDKIGKVYRDRYEVDPSTVGQYTGRNDKDGAELYDGDILHRDCYGDVRIEFEKGVFWVRDAGGVRYANRCCDIPISYFPTEDYEKIGNIHDNPELLEV